MTWYAYSHETNKCTGISTTLQELTNTFERPQPGEVGANFYSTFSRKCSWCEGHGLTYHNMGSERTCPQCEGSGIQPWGLK